MQKEAKWLLLDLVKLYHRKGFVGPASVAQRYTSLLTTPIKLLMRGCVSWWDGFTVWAVTPYLRHTAVNQPDVNVWVCVGHSPHCVRGTLRCWGDWLKDLSWACRLSPAYSWDLSACFPSCARWGLKFCVAAQRPGLRPLSSLLRPAWRAGLVPPRDRRLDGWSRVNPDEMKPGGYEQRQAEVEEDKTGHVWARCNMGRVTNLDSGGVGGWGGNLWTKLGSSLRTLWAEERWGENKREKGQTKQLDRNPEI